MERGGDVRAVESHEARREGLDVDGLVLNQLDRREGDVEGDVPADDTDALLPKDSHELGLEPVEDDDDDDAMEEVGDVGEERSVEDAEGDRRHSEQALYTRGETTALSLPFDRLRSSSLKPG